MRRHAQSLVRAAGGLLAALAVAAAHAESLADPTRPPAALGASAADGAPEASGLQSIIRSNIGRPAAIINGEYVVLGGRVGDARLVKIGDDSVTLKTAAGTETLMLVPGVEKKAVTDRKTESGSIRKKSHNEVSR